VFKDQSERKSIASAKSFNKSRLDIYFRRAEGWLRRAEGWLRRAEGWLPFDSYK